MQKVAARLRAGIISDNNSVGFSVPAVVFRVPRGDGKAVAERWGSVHHHREQNIRWSECRRRLVGAPESRIAGPRPSADLPACLRKGKLNGKLQHGAGAVAGAEPAPLRPRGRAAGELAAHQRHRGAARALQPAGEQLPTLLTVSRTTYSTMASLTSKLFERFVDKCWFIITETHGKDW